MITIKVRLAKSEKDRIVGLIGRNKAEPVMFLTRFGIHTFGVRFPIDVIVLDKDDAVVKLKEGLKPSNLFFWPVKFNKVLELPEGFIRGKKFRLGSKISLKLV